MSFVLFCLGIFVLFISVAGLVVLVEVGPEVWKLAEPYLKLWLARKFSEKK